jgi:hypothetical protein
MKDHTNCGKEPCEHINLGYCKTCKAPYCKDCGFEWKITWHNDAWLPSLTPRYADAYLKDKMPEPTKVWCNHAEAK